MAGKNQHYIPQMLLRAFRIGPGKIARVHKFQPEGIFPLATREVAAQDWFYSHASKDGGKTLDDLITDYEGGALTSDFRTIMAAPAGAVDPALAARIIGHLFGRSDHVRSTLRSGIGALADHIEQIFGSEEQIRFLLGADDTLPGDRFRDAFGKALADQPLLALLEMPAAALEPIAFMFLRENITDGAAEITGHARALSERFRNEAGDMARDAQTKSLANTLLPPERVDLLTSFAWSIVDVEQPLFILPDFVALAANAKGETGTLLHFDAGELDQVRMPLSPLRMLVGQRNPRPIDLDDFNAEAVPHCLAFFVSAYRDPGLEALRPTIGRSALASVAAALSEATATFRRGLDEAAGTPTSPGASWDIEQPQNVMLEAAGLDDEMRDRFVELLRKILAWARTRYDVSALLRIVIADDYEKTLATIDRGALANEEAVIPSTSGMSVAYNVPVEQDGRIGVALVLRPGIPAMLLDDDDSQFAAASSILLSQLARLGAEAMLRSVFSDGVQVGNAVDRLLMEKALAIWRNYFIGTYEGQFSEDMRSDYRDELLDHLTGMADRMVTARRDYRVHGRDTDFSGLAIDEAAQAALLAALAASASDEEADAAELVQFRARLDTLGLLKWFELLRSDLAGIWEEGMAYPAQEAFLVLSLHLRRLLLLGGVFLYESDGAARFAVPHILDLDWYAGQAAGESPSAPAPS
ncbi:hypothetical protein [Sphingobium chungangianum]